MCLGTVFEHRGVLSMLIKMSAFPPPPYPSLRSLPETYTEKTLLTARKLWYIGRGYGITTNSFTTNSFTTNFEQDFLVVKRIF